MRVNVRVIICSELNSVCMWVQTHNNGMLTSASGKSSIIKLNRLQDQTGHQLFMVASIFCSFSDMSASHKSYWLIQCWVHSFLSQLYGGKTSHFVMCLPTPQTHTQKKVKTQRCIMGNASTDSLFLFKQSFIFHRRKGESTRKGGSFLLKQVTCLSVFL